TTNEDTSVNINVLANDSDIDTNLNTLNVTSATATNGAVSIGSDQTLTYQPNTNFNGTDVINYVVDDNNGGTASGTVALTIVSVNDAPVALNDATSTHEDTQVTINVLTNDSDVDGDSLATLSAIALNGNVSVNSDNSLNYDPNANFNGSDTISYTITDNNDATASATVEVSVIAVNDDPIANADTTSTSEDTVVNINVLSNDTDIDSANLSLISATADNGIVTLTSNNTLDYQPKENFNGTDTINYAISDNDGGSASSTVLVSVSAVNDQPTAVNDNVTTDEDTAVNIAVLSNDVDIDGDQLTLLTATANNGTAVVNTDNTVGYTPNPNFNGSDTVSYSISDNNGGSASATVAVTINNVNDLPVAANDSATTTEDTAVTINVLSNDSDIDNDPLTISAATANNANVSVNNDQTLQYTPNTNFFGADIISYTVEDGQGGSASATVSVAVTGVNDNPTAVSDNVAMQEDSTANLDPLANDFDVDGDALVIILANSNNGSVALVAGQSLIYAPNPNYFGADIITYSISDNKGGTDFAFINIDISPVNDVPVATNDSANTDEDVPVTVNVLANDFDVDNDPLTITSANASSGNVTINSSNLTYTPNANFHGTDNVIYVISDGAGSSASGTLTVVVNNLNDIPVANADSATLDEDTSVIIAVLTNDTDADGDTLTITSATLASSTNSGGPSGTLAINTDKTLTYIPKLNFNGTDTVNYSIEDGNGASNATTVTITVRSVNDLPIANADTSTTAEDTPINITVLGNDTDIDGDALIVKTATASNGTVIIALDNTLDYTPNSNFNGTDTINYTVDDGNTGQSSSTVTVTITPVNDLPIAVADAASTAEDTSVNITVLTNDSDPEGDPLTVTAATAINGSTSVKSDFTISYIPNSNFHGTDTISYTLDDGIAGSSIGIVTVTVTSVNDVPVAVNDATTGNEDARIIVDVLANDTDADGDTLTVTAVTTTNGTVSVQSDQSLEVLANIDFNGTVTISYTISDGQGGTASAAAVVTVTPVNDNPKPVADTASTSINTQVNILVLSNDLDPEGDTLTITAANAVNGTTAVVSAGTSIDYTPNNGFTGGHHQLRC
ncbi:MAG: tandem-95 repeat protein, partial [Algicola sp.]|nr:tandem-95 repeat protein [Algicola sp.]